MPRNPFSLAEPDLQRNGYSPVPIVPGTKRPAMTCWQECCSTPVASDTAARFAVSPHAYGIGVALGYRGLIAIDLDSEDPAVISAARRVLPGSRVAKRGARGRTDFYRDPAGTVRARKFKARDGAMLVEVLAGGNQAVIPPSNHPVTGKSYEWLTADSLFNTAVGELPVIPPDIVERLASALARWTGPALPRPLPALAATAARDLSEPERRCQARYARAILDRDVGALAGMCRNSGRNAAAFRLACRVGRWVHHRVLSADAVADAILAACERNGLVAEDGRRSVLATIASGLRKSTADMLPDLGTRHG